MSLRAKDREHEKIILFDGVCNLCNRSVLFVLQREKTPTCSFASIQSAAGQTLLQRYGLPSNYSEAVVLIDQGNMYLGAMAALRIGRTLRFPWSLLSRLGLLVPVVVRDGIYRQIARHRYRWFGRQDICVAPTEALKSRFLE